MGEKDRRTGTSTCDDAVGPVLKYGFPVSTQETGHVKHTKPPTTQPPTSRANETTKVRGCSHDDASGHTRSY